jgi:6-phosphogluconolactonase (cycloisomerase 2 family)
MVLKKKREWHGTVLPLIACVCAVLAVMLITACSNPLVSAVVATRSAAVWSRVIALPATEVAANHAVTLSWPATQGAESYNLYWSTSPNPTISTATEIRNVSSPYVHEGLTNNLDYYYFLTASIPESESKPSAVTRAMPMQTVVYVNSYNRVNIYPVDNTTGALGALITGPNFGLGQISGIAVDTARKYAYLADRGYAKVYSFEINSDTGALSEAGSPVSTGASSFPSYIVIDSGSGYVYVVNSGTKNIMGYRVNSLDGSLTALTSGFPVTLANEQINGVTISPSRPFIYFSTYDFNSTPYKGHIYSQSINTGTGELLPVGTATETPCFPGPIAFSLAGDFLYVTNQSDHPSIVDFYSYPVISSSGVLETPPISNSIHQVSLNNIRNSGLAIDPLGRFLFVGNYMNDNSLTIFRISNGALSIVPVGGKDSLSISYAPGYMAVDTNGHCLYVVNESKIESYSINQTTGALTWLATTETLAAGDNNTNLGYYLIRDITVVSLP